METIVEIRLKSLFITDDIIQREIQKLDKKLVLSQEISFHRKPNYKEVKELLHSFLNRTKFTWVDLDIYFLVKTERSVLFPRRTKTEVFVFGKRKVILENIEEIVGRIICGKRWITKEVRISPEQEFNIKNFLIL